MNKDLQCRMINSFVPSWNDYSYTELKPSLFKASEKSSQESSQEPTQRTTQTLSGKQIEI